MQHEAHRVPVTALGFWGEDVILAGEGNFLHCYHARSKTLLAKVLVFPTQAIHGIVVANGDEARAILLFGGCLVRGVRIISNDECSIDVLLGSVYEAADWIQDAAFCAEQRARVALVTAHGALLVGDLLESLNLEVEAVVAGSNCILYCAHVVWLGESRCLVASGTAFGDVVLWSASILPNGRQVCSEVQTHYTFSAHDGSVFGLQISRPGTTYGYTRLLASCSDDRTVRLWDISDLRATSVDVQRQTGFGRGPTSSSSAPPLLAKVMGHLSRIWHVRFHEPYVYATDAERESQPQQRTFLTSFGEDASSITWSVCLDGVERRSLPLTLERHGAQKAHAGKNIWSVCVDGRARCATGGADGAIVLRTLSDGSSTDLSRTELVLPSEKAALKTADYVRSYSFLSSSQVLASTDAGRVVLLQVDGSSSSGREILTATVGLRGYSVSAAACGVGFVAGSDGVVYAFPDSESPPTLLLDTGRKVAGLFAQSLPDVQGVGGDEDLALLVANMGASAATCCFLQKREGCVLSQRRALALPRGFVVTSFALSPAPDSIVVVLGSRCGSLAFFRLSRAAHGAEPVTHDLLIPSVHGVESVTSLLSVPGGTATEVLLLSTGRDGTYAAHRIALLGCGVALTTVHQLRLPFGPNIEGCCYASPTPHLLVWGFRGSFFVVYDVDAQREVLEVECGGAHRIWSFQAGAYGGKLVWTQASKLYCATQSALQLDVVRAGGHGREIKCAAFSPSCALVLATGAEDTDVQLGSYAGPGPAAGFRCLHTLRRHNTGVQHVAWSTDGKRLFSSGGCEELFVWRVRVRHGRSVDADGAVSLGVVCESAHPSSGSSDLRIVHFDLASPSQSSFVISAVYSDSSLRSWEYQPQLASWKLLWSASYLTSCLTRCLRCVEPFSKTLVTASTDGYIALWSEGPPPHTPSKSLPPSSADKWQTSPLRHRIHQSAILDATAFSLPRDSATYFLTVGDDSSLALTRYDNRSAQRAAVGFRLRTLLVPRAHAAAATAVRVVSISGGGGGEEEEEEEGKGKRRGAVLVHAVTAGADQRVKMWEITIREKGTWEEGEGMERVDVSCMADVYTGVADAAGLELVREGEEGKGGVGVLVCGVGMEVWRLRKR